MAARSFQRELYRMLDEEVIIELKNGKRLRGVIRAIRPDTLAVILSNVVMGGETYSTIVLSGDTISAIYLKKLHIELDEIREMLEKVFPPRTVYFNREKGVIVVMDKVRVTERGVEGEPGLVYDKVKKIYDEYMSRKKL